MNRLKRYAPVIYIATGLLFLVLGIAESSGALRIARLALGVLLILMGAARHKRQA